MRQNAGGGPEGGVRGRAVGVNVFRCSRVHVCIYIHHRYIFLFINYLDVYTQQHRTSLEKSFS